jgi:hypothetical protein
MLLFGNELVYICSYIYLHISRVAMAATSCSITGKRWTFLPDIEKSTRGKDDENGFDVDCKYCC